ncbi:hypothetical protein [Streptomyces sp. NPDC051776]|uniref:hypothetical protein n=1 Tax=Streptomyces sp. NPDC051776 TaxID=3155414 RepID=UPI003442FC6A
MSRPADWKWEPLGESSDPVPGDVYDLKSLATRFTKTAETISKSAAALRRIGDLKSWDSDAGKEFAEKAKETAHTVSKAHKRYDEAGKALKEYWTDLEEIQREADRLLEQAETAAGDVTSAQRKADNPPEGTDDKGQKDLDDKVETAQGHLAELRSQLGKLKTRHGNAGKKAADRIHEVTENDDLNDSWLDELRDALNAIANIAGAIAAVCGILSLLVGWIPVIGQALAGILGTIALVATAVSLICHLLLFINGDAEWTDLAMDVLGLATFGIGRVFSSASKLAATLGRSRVWDAANRFVRTTAPHLNSAQRRMRVIEMVGRRAGARSWDAARPDVSFGAAFKGLRGGFADDLATIRNNWREIYNFSGQGEAIKQAWQSGGLRGIGSMYTGPGMVDELGKMKAISSETLARIGAPDAFRQSAAYSGFSMGAMAVGGFSDSFSAVKASLDASGSVVDEFLLGRSGLDVTGSDSALTRG